MIAKENREEVEAGIVSANENHEDIWMEQFAVAAAWALAMMRII